MDSLFRSDSNVLILQASYDIQSHIKDNWDPVTCACKKVGLRRERGRGGGEGRDGERRWEVREGGRGRGGMEREGGRGEEMCTSVFKLARY